MVSKWIITLIYPIYKQAITHLLTIYSISGTSQAGSVIFSCKASIEALEYVHNQVNWPTFLEWGTGTKKSLVTSHQVLRKAFQVDLFSVGNFSITAKPPTVIFEMRQFVNSNSKEKPENRNPNWWNDGMVQFPHV